MSTKHATLPFWNEKLLEQKVDELFQQVNDLYAYFSQFAFQDLVMQLNSYQPFDELEREHLLKFKEFIRLYPNIYNKNCEAGHFTGSALVIDEISGKFLLHFHKKLNKWLQFGGHPEYETDFSEVALRECYEETGLSDLHFFQGERNIVDIDLQLIPQRQNEPEHYHLDLRYLLSTRLPEKLDVDSNEESTLFRWIAFDEIESLGELINPSLKRLLHKGWVAYSGRRS